ALASADSSDSARLRTPRFCSALSTLGALPDTRHPIARAGENIRLSKAARQCALGHVAILFEALIDGNDNSAALCPSLPACGLQCEVIRLHRFETNYGNKLSLRRAVHG
ncbi:hypothetical protein, partial [Tritonibacter mobilis]|uniref:hypothetical protein n=1 Tax=Tritonibacter mobilis TaxID=379347 RepID=UPI0013A67457